MLLRTVSITNDRFKPLTITRIEPNLDTASHPKIVARRFAKGTLLYRSYH
jgi:hypothetical protein